MRSFLALLAVGTWALVGSVALAQQPTRPSPAAPKAVARPAPGPSPVATVKQIMKAMTAPSADAIFGAVGSVLQVGVAPVERVPRTDEEWSTVASRALVLAESANLLMVEGRTREVAGRIPASHRADWTMKAKELQESARVALRAARAKDVQALSDASDRIDSACDECHESYQNRNPSKGRQRPDQKPFVVIRYPDKR